MALDTLVSAGITWAPVTKDRRVRGIIAITDIIGAYQRGLRRSQHLLADIRGIAMRADARGDGSNACSRSRDQPARICDARSGSGRVSPPRAGVRSAWRLCRRGS